jgi:hypothetical protein
MEIFVPNYWGSSSLSVQKIKNKKIKGKKYTPRRLISRWQPSEKYFLRMFYRVQKLDPRVFYWWQKIDPMVFYQGEKLDSRVFYRGEKYVPKWHIPRVSFQGCYPEDPMPELLVPKGTLRRPLQLAILRSAQSCAEGPIRTKRPVWGTLPKSPYRVACKMRNSK